MLNLRLTFKFYILMLTISFFAMVCLYLNSNVLSNSYLHQFDKKYGFVLYGYNCLNVKCDFAYWFKTKKEAIKKLESEE